MRCLHCNAELPTPDSHYGLHKACFRQRFATRDLPEFSALARQEMVSDGKPELPSEPYLSSYFAGNYRKYEAILNDKRYLLKFQKTEYPELVPVEYFCNRVAELCHIPVPVPYGMIWLNNEYVFAVRNFMEEMIPPYNLVHIYHYSDKGVRHFSVSNLAKVIQEQTGRITDVETFLRTVLYDALIGNHDRHGRNLAIIETGTGKLLSPIYDNTSALGLESGALPDADWNPYGKIVTGNNLYPSMSDYVQEIEDLDFLYLIKEFRETTTAIDFAALLDGIPVLSKRMKGSLLRLINKRRKELNHEYPG